MTPWELLSVQWMAAVPAQEEQLGALTASAFLHFTSGAGLIPLALLSAQPQCLVTLKSAVYSACGA